MRCPSLILLLILFTPILAAASSPPLVLPLWPGTPPDEPGTIGLEKVVMSPKLDRSQVEVTESTRMVTNATRPTLIVYRPAKGRDTGTAMLICPGGGHWNLYWELEGEEVAAWLNAVGVTGIILKYRVPRRPDEPKGEPARRPLQDAQRAVSLVRRKAKEWGIAPDRIGIIGFSAGGHLAVATVTSFEKRTYEPVDDVDNVSCRPDFAIPVYSGYLKAKDRDGLAAGLRVPKGTPPVLLVHGSADLISDPEHSVVMYRSLKRAGVSAGLHVYADSAHDSGVRKVGRPCDAWTACVEWLQHRGMLKQVGKRGRRRCRRPIPGTTRRGRNIIHRRRRRRRQANDPAPVRPQRHRGSRSWKGRYPMDCSAYPLVPPRVVAVAIDKYLTPTHPFPDPNLPAGFVPKYGQDITWNTGGAAPKGHNVGSTELELRDKAWKLLSVFASKDKSLMARRLFTEFFKKQAAVKYFDDADLNKAAAAHANVRSFCNAALAAPPACNVSHHAPPPSGKVRIHQALKQANWDIRCMIAPRDLGVPAFNNGTDWLTSGDYGNGLGVMINGVQYVYILATHYHYDKAAKTYCIRLQFRFYDVFGLDDDDLAEKGAMKDGWGNTTAGVGITAWWQLQHQFGYVPLVTRIVLENDYEVAAL